MGEEEEGFEVEKMIKTLLRGGRWRMGWDCDSDPPPFPAASETMIITSEQTAVQR